jgi:hypothetical protein
VETEVPFQGVSRNALWSVSNRRGRGDTSCLELKTTDLISMAHEAQVLHYLRASSMEVG